MKKRLKFSRRKFVQGAALLAGAPTVIPSEALGLCGRVPPSERITLGMIGMGGIMNWHLNDMLNRREVQVLAVCDVDAGKRTRAVERVEQRYARSMRSGAYKGCDAVLEHERIAERSDVDACFVTTPDHWHVPIAMDCIRNGKHVYLEKPMSLTVREGRIFADAARRYGAIVQVGSMQRSNWYSFRKAAEIVRNGWIGKVHSVYAWLGSFAPPVELPEEAIPAGFDYERWLGPAPWRPYNPERVAGRWDGGWRCYWDYGERKNGDWGAHHYDIVQWAFGMDDSGPVLFFPKGFEGKNWQGFRYADGRTVYRDRPGETRTQIEFRGETGIVGVSRGNVIRTRPDSLAGRPLAAEDVHLYASSNHHQNWLDSIRSGKQPICNANVGHRTATISHLSAISERLNRPVRWDPEKEEIIGDPEASRRLDRPRRAPYLL